MRQLHAPAQILQVTEHAHSHSLAISRPRRMRILVFFDETEKFFNALTAYLGEGNVDDEKLESVVTKEAIHCGL